MNARTARWGWILIIGIFSATGSWSQSAPPISQGNGDLPTADQLQAKIESSQSLADLSEAIRNEIVQQYQQALGDLKRLEELAQQSTELENQVKEAPEQTRQLKAALEKPTDPLPDVPKEAARLSNEELTKKASESRQALDAAETERGNRSNALNEQRALPSIIPDQRRTFRKSLSETELALGDAAPADQPQSLTEARRTALRLRQHRLQAEIALLEHKLSAHDKLLAWHTERLNQAESEVERLEQVDQLWKKAGDERSQQGAGEGERQAIEVWQQTEGMHESIRKLAQENIELSKQNKELVEKTIQLRKQYDQNATLLQQIQEQSEKTHNYVQLSGLDETVGLLLRSQREALPPLSRYRANTDERRSALSKANQRQYELRQEAKNLADIDLRAERIVSALSPGPVGGERKKYINKTRSLLLQRKRWYNDLYAQYSDYIKTVGQLDSKEREIIVEVEEFTRFINTHLMWSREAGAINLDTFRYSAEALTSLAQPEPRTAVVEQVKQTFIRRTAAATALTLTWLALLLLYLRSLGSLKSIAPDIGRVRADSMKLTLRALAVTVLRAVVWPGLLAGLAWLSYAPQITSAWVAACSAALLQTAGLWAVLEGLRGICDPNGLGPVHFRWSAGACKAVRRHLSWSMAVLLPLVGLALLVDRAGVDDQQRTALVLLCHMAIGIVVTVAVALMLYPRGSFQGALAGARMDKAAHLWWLWYPLAIALPLAPVVLAGLGYHHAATQLQYRLFLTVAFSLLLIVIQALALRWLLLTHRRVAYQEALHKLEEARDLRRKELEAAGQARAGETSSEEPSVPAEPERSIEQIASDTRRLVFTVIGFTFVLVFWLVWQPVLPALNFLNDVEVWSYITEGKDGPMEVSITLANLIFAFLVGAITVIATSALPSVLEITLLKRLPLEPGVGYAISTLSRYILLGIGIVIAFDLIGVGWTDVQFIIAALGVGIGFGLQEIVANFISGIIILFERPIRVGDIVEVGGVMGIVSRIRIRATTITNWDRKEYIVPNKDFITGRLLNWTLSNKINRIVINVGVAYGSNVEQTRSILRRVIDEHPLIMKDPTTLITFEGFGDNALNFVVRTYLPDFDNRLEVVHQLHETIYDELNKAGIAIAFPQRDVHLDTSKPLEIRVTDKRKEDER